ncbi:MAG: BON domain-containing protein [Verrucomicrobiia bacterium]
MNRDLCVIVLLLLAGCARQTPPQESVAATPAFRAMGQSVTVEEAYTDEATGFAIRRRLATENPGASAGIIIEVSNGIVTLRGVAPTQAVAWRAEATAHAVKGVKQVRNQIVITTTPALP